MIKNRITFRSASTDDLDFLKQLRKSTMTNYLEKAGICLTDRDNLDRINYRFDTAKIILFDEQAVGMLKAYRDKNKWIIVQIQIAPSYQGKGIGSFLVKRVIDKAAHEGLSVSLSVLKDNPAVKLYRELGFKIEDETDIEYSMIKNS